MSRNQRNTGHAGKKHPDISIGRIHKVLTGKSVFICRHCRRKVVKIVLDINDGFSRFERVSLGKFEKIHPPAGMMCGKPDAVCGLFQIIKLTGKKKFGTVMMGKVVTQQSINSSKLLTVIQLQRGYPAADRLNFHFHQIIAELHCRSGKQERHCQY